jgi:F1F0 ATPase subunit 2
MSWNEVFSLALAMIGGAALGVFFFGGLWWTIKQLPHARQPALLIMGSFLVRIGVLIGGLYVLAAGQLLALAAALVGVLLARSLIVRRQTRAPLGVSHAAKP